MESHAQGVANVCQNGSLQEKYSDLFKETLMSEITALVDTGSDHFLVQYILSAFYFFISICCISSHCPRSVMYSLVS